MRIDNCEFERLLPLFMQNQKDDLALAKTLNPTIRDIGEKIKLCSDWGVIDDLPEEFIDALAWELDIDWFNPKADRTLEVKKELVKNADNVHKKLGTKAAIESVARDIFGDGTVEEWFEIGTAPGTFRLWVSVQLTPENVARFMKTVGQVKNTRSHLLSVTCRVTTDLDGEDVDHGEIIDSYGETEIYNQFWLTSAIDHTELESIEMIFKHRDALEISESVAAGATFKFEIEESESARASIVRKSDPCYYFNNVITYDGSHTYSSFYEEEDI